MSARTKSQHLQALVATAMLSAVALVLMLLEFPLLPAAPYLKMDFSDVPAVLAGVLFGITQQWLYAALIWIGAFGCLAGAVNFRNWKKIVQDSENMK